MSWETLGDVAFYVAAFSSALFAVLYLFFAPWWKTSAGRNIMAVMGILALAFGYFAWAIANDGPPPGFLPMRALLFIGIALSVSWRTMLFIRHHVVRSLRGRARERMGNELEDAR